MPRRVLELTKGQFVECATFGRFSLNLYDWNSSEEGVSWGLVQIFELEYPN